jgi:hypothetical protein
MGEVLIVAGAIAVLGLALSVFFDSKHHRR